MIDNSLVEKLLNDLDDLKLKILLDGLKAGAKVIFEQSKSNLRAKSPRLGNLTSGIKMKVDNAYSEVMVHIMGDYRLKFFEKGTKLRITKTKANRGTIKPLYFFKSATSADGDITSAIEQSITTALNKLG